MHRAQVCLFDISCVGLYKLWKEYIAHLPVMEACITHSVQSLSETPGSEMPPSQRWSVTIADIQKAAGYSAR